jgi:hypothetical protein
VQDAGSSLVGVTLTDAKDDGELLVLREALDFFIQDREELLRVALVSGTGTIGRFHDEGVFAEAPALGVLAAAASDPCRDAEKPTGERGSVPEGPGFADEDQEYGLEGVFDVVKIVKESPADSEDQGTVAGDQLSEGALVVAGQELVEELAISLVGQGAGGE